MTSRIPRKVVLLGTGCGLALLAGCSGSLQQMVDSVGPKPQYESSKSLPPLEIPPGLSSDNVKDTMPVPQVGGDSANDGSTTYSAYTRSMQDAATVQQTSAVLPSVPQVKLEGSGDHHWLLVDATPAAVWPKVREFWIQNGFTLKTEDPSTGVMETDWAVNTADIPKNFLTGLLGKVMPTVNSASTRDKFRTWLEPGSKPGTTEIHISHRGLQAKVVGNMRDADYIGWVPRPPDPGATAAMLNKLMVYLGVDQQKAKQQMAAAHTNAPRAQLVHEANGAVALKLPEDFSRAWQRTGLALDRGGFTVEDRDRSRGVYYVHYIDPNNKGESGGSSWLSKLKFWSSNDNKKKASEEYLISLVGAESSTRVVVLDKQGKRDTSPTATRILNLLHKQLE